MLKIINSTDGKAIEKGRFSAASGRLANIGVHVELQREKRWSRNVMEPVEAVSTAAVAQEGQIRETGAKGSSSRIRSSLMT